VRLTDPELAGPTVRLRPWRPEDAPALAAAWADAEVSAHTRVPDPATVETAARWIGGWRTRADHGRALDLVVSGVDDDEVRGEVGLGPIDWPRHTAEIGFWIAAPQRGRGIATEAVTLLADWAIGELPLRHVVARVHPDHSRSWRVLAAAGFRRRGRLSSGHDLWDRPVRTADRAGNPGGGGTGC
jgi:RimJ/RimL family protein N-acetyltransferase